MMRILTSPGMSTSTRRRPESSFVHDQSRGTLELIFWGLEMADEEFFMIPRKPGRELGDFPEDVLDLGSVEMVPSVFDISWIRGTFPLAALPISLSGIELVDAREGVVAAPVKVARVDVGIWTNRGRSLPLLAILGVPISRDNDKFVCDSMRCNASSK